MLNIVVYGSVYSKFYKRLNNETIMETMLFNITLKNLSTYSITLKSIKKIIPNIVYRGILNRLRVIKKSMSFSPKFCDENFHIIERTYLYSVVFI